MCVTGESLVETNHTIMYAIYSDEHVCVICLDEWSIYVYKYNKWFQKLGTEQSPLLVESYKEAINTMPMAASIIM